MSLALRGQPLVLPALGLNKFCHLASLKVSRFRTVRNTKFAETFLHIVNSIREVQFW
jgi:hypothetical protein